MYTIFKNITGPIEDQSKPTFKYLILKATQGWAWVTTDTQGLSSKDKSKVMLTVYDSADVNQ